MHGEFVVDDLKTLFLSLRFRSYGRKLVKEIGDFVAHADERDRGIATDLFSPFIAHVRFQMPYYREPVDLGDLPASFPDVLTYNLDRIEAQTIYRDTGFRPKQAKRKFPDLLRKFSKKPDGRYRQTVKLDQDETKLLSVLIGYVVVKAAFTDSDLIREFIETLVKNDLLEQKETKKFQELQTLVALFGMSTMHQCKLILEDGVAAELYIGWCDPDKGTIGIIASCPTPIREVATLHMAVSLFSTSLIGKDHCEESLITSLNTNPNPTPVFNLGVELTQNQKLRFIKAH